MKKVLVLFLTPLVFVACTGSGTNTTSSPATDSAVATAAVSLPYTATYSSSFIPGKASDVATVLNNYKAWETGDMKAMKETYGDSVTLIFPNGTVYNNKLDSMMIMANKYRDSLSNVSLSFFAWTSNHSADKNEDWVNVWYKETDTYKSGKVDSVIYQDDNLLKGGKIVWVSSHSQKLKK